MKIKYLSLNIWIGGKLFRPMVEFLKQENADIVALQEVFNGHGDDLPERKRTLEILTRELGYPHHAFAPAFFDTTDGLNIEMGETVFSRFPITESRAIFFDIPYGPSQPTYAKAERTPRILQHTVVNAQGTELNIFNVHGIWGQDGEDNPRRLEMSQSILEAIDEKPNVILSGDFNVREDTETIRNIQERFRNMFAGELTTTFNMKQKTEAKFARAVVDFIFVGPNFRVLDHRAPQVDVSDHMPLTVTLKT